MNQLFVDCDTVRPDCDWLCFLNMCSWAFVAHGMVYPKAEILSYFLCWMGYGNTGKRAMGWIKIIHIMC